MDVETRERVLRSSTKNTVILSAHPKKKEKSNESHIPPFHIIFHIIPPCYNGGALGLVQLSIIGLVPFLFPLCTAYFLFYPFTKSKIPSFYFFVIPPLPFLFSHPVALCVMFPNYWKNYWLF